LGCHRPLCTGGVDPIHSIKAEEQYGESIIRTETELWSSGVVELLLIVIAKVVHGDL
jgi:hypothetical protein